MAAATEAAATAVRASPVVAARVATEAMLRRLFVVPASLERSRRFGTSTSLSVYLPSYFGTVGARVQLRHGCTSKSFPR